MDDEKYTGVSEVILESIKVFQSSISIYSRNVILLLTYEPEQQ